MKFKIFSFKSIVTYLTMVSFYIATTLSAFAAPLPPISLAQMYSLASQGNVRALRAAVQRGMNIDATDRYGNTGLCHSIYQNNYTAYNAFHASGANPRHPCIQNIPPQQYDYFMASSRATPVTATPRDAYKEFADGEFVFSTTTWVIGGLLLAGGIAAIALSGGGGGKKHHYYFPPNDSFTPTDDSLGAFVGTETPSAPENSPYTPVKITNGENDSNFTLSNDSQIKVGDETKNLVDVINLNDSVLDYTKYIQVGMKAIDGNQVVNGKIPLTGTEVGATITLQNNTAGMVALHNSNAINNNTLKIIARNGTLGMIASDKSLVRNNGNIDIAFQGTTATDQVDGMYADTSSTAINDGKITGNAAVDSVAGTLIGMQGRLINQVQNPAGTIPTQLINNGNISLSAAATPDKTISTSLVGMGSFLEKAFLEGTKLLRRTGFIEITNAANGVIDLNVNLGDSGTYDSTQSNLLNGTGGIVGIRSDAHTTATNNGTIRLTIAPESTNNITNSHAGMLSVHGGTIVNNKEITVTGGIGGYGMLGVRGEGTNSEFNTLNPTIVNSESGTISVNSTDGFGMATRHGGTVVNKGTIKMLAKGTGLQINAGTGTNSGTITLSNGGDGMTIRQNVTTEAGTANNASSAKIQNTETGVIDIKYANGSNGMFIEDGTAENNGSIKINGTDSTTTEASYGIHAQNGTMLNTGSIDMDVILSGDADSYGMYGENSASATNAATGKITFTRKGTGMYTTQGTNTNHGQIVMNGIGSTGMASESGAVLNGKTGSIQLVSGTGIKSTSGSVTNQGSINISQGEDSVGISSGSNAVNDKDATIQITGANSTGISVEENATAVNRGTITLTSTQNSKENYGMISAGGERAQIDNDGIINLNGYDYAASKEVGYGMSIGDGRANNNNTININRMYGYGMASTEGTLTNNGTINLTNGGYGIMGESGESFNNKDATITITGTPNMQNSYGMSMQDGTAKNFGQIDVTGGSVDSKTYGISVNGGNGLNHGLINMHSDNAFGLFDEGDGEITNVAGGTINLYGNNSVGMQTTSGKAENFGTINIGVDNGTGAIVGGSGSTGMIAGDGATAINSGHINMNGNNAVGMTANGGTVINDKSGTITLNGGNGTIFTTTNDGTAINNGDIVINAEDYTLFSTTDSDEGNFQNNGNVTVGAGGSKVIIAGDGNNITNSGKIDLNGKDGFIIYTKGNGSVTNNGTLEIGEDSNNSHGIYMSETATGTVLNDLKGIINVKGTNSSGMTLASDTDTVSITNKGKINVDGTGSKGITSTKGGTVNNEGTITIADGSAAIEAAGGTVNNKAGASITTEKDSRADGINISSNANSGATVTNDGTITVNGSGSAINSSISATSPAETSNTINNNGVITITGNGNGIWADTATVTNAAGARIEVGGSGYGIRASKGSITNSGTITVSGSNGTGMSGGGTLVNDKTITASGSGSKGMEVTTGGTGTNNKDITASGSNSSGIYVNGGTADNIGTIISSGNGSSGIYAANGEAYNQTTISVAGEGSIGMTAGSGTVTNGKTVQIPVLDEDGEPVLGDDDQPKYEEKDLPGTINVVGSNAAGMKLAGSGKVINNKGATINVSGAGSTGIWAAGSGSAVNNGTINVSAADTAASGMRASTGTATNNAAITVTGNGAQGMYADGGNVVNAASGTIDLKAENTVGIYVANGSGSNLGTINLGGTGAIGLQADGGTATNSGSLKVSGTDTVGLYANGGTVVNSGTIEFSSGDAAVLVDDGIGRNNKTITVTSSNLEAMRADGGEAVNASGGTITLNSSANNSTAMYATRGKITNNGTIALNGSSGIGMMTEAEGTANNTGTINVSGADSVGILADGGTATNSSGTINVTGSSSFGMKATEGEAINNATINANNNIGMFADGGIVTNGSSGKINAGSGASYLMLAENGGTANNKGTLTFSGSGSALQAKGATVNNTGSITATGSGNGMAADGTSSAGANAVNSGTITVNSGKGMIATSTTIDTTVTNASGGVITVNSNGGVGMYADGSHARAINLGTINIKGTSSTSYGMKAVNGGSVENAGTINMAAGSAGTGIYVDGKSTFYNNASGKIVFAGGQTQSGTITGDTSAGSVDICDDGGSCANKFIHLEQGATLQNSGTMITSASFKLNEMGGGRVLLASTGTMVAGNEISGDLYAVSDRAILEQGQKDVYVNRNALTASEIDVNLMSASPMWEVSLVDSAEDSADDAAAQAEDEPAVEQPTVKDEDEADNDSSTSDKPSSEKDIVYNRVAFSNLVNNASQAAYLESNYAIRNTIYDGMITAGSMEEFNQALYSNLGLDLIPNFAKQNMDILRNVNRQVNSAVFNNNDTKEFRVHVGYDYFEREQDGTNGLSGYEDEAHTGYALFDKKYNANFRYGLGASFTKYSSDYDNGAERDEVIAQIMAPLIFETDSTKVVSMPRIGMGWGEYTRYDHTGEYKADTRNYYYGITNEARHELDMGLLTLEPVAEFNIIGLYQGRTKENIRVDSGNNLSVEGGLGLYAKKSFKPMGDDELNIRLGGTYYHEFNNPYQAVSAGIVGLQGRYHMNSYETQRNRAVLSSRFDYKRGKFNFYLEGSRFIEDDSTYSVNAGLTYAF